MTTLTFRLARPGDWPVVWQFWRQIVGDGRTYLWSPRTDEATARQLWMLPAPAEVWVVERQVAGGEATVVGSATLRPNQPDLGAHVANAAFMVDPAFAGSGIGRALASHILERARSVGFAAMQFNAVLADNPAVRLWQSLGFSIVGRTPGGCRRADGDVDLLVMHRNL